MHVGEFQTVIDTATDVNEDGVIKIGLRSGVNVINEADSGDMRVEIPWDNIHICGESAP